ncbi:MAG: hypothetical protein HY831_02605 [Candidatus Aenigmarchaeota archaeon]|nr:hypothetical protein [Candidatus Aenigmarchaeota archaeon]
MSSSYPTLVDDSSDRKFHGRLENVPGIYSDNLSPTSDNKGYVSQRRAVHTKSFAGEDPGFEEFTDGW